MNPQAKPNWVESDTYDASDDDIHLGSGFLQSVTLLYDSRDGHAISATGLLTPGSRILTGMSSSGTAWTTVNLETTVLPDRNIGFFDRDSDGELHYFLFFYSLKKEWSTVPPPTSQKDNLLDYMKGTLG